MKKLLLIALLIVGCFAPTEHILSLPIVKDIKDNWCF